MAVEPKESPAMQLMKEMGFKNTAGASVVQPENTETKIPEGGAAPATENAPAPAASVPAVETTTTTDVDEVDIDDDKLKAALKKRGIIVDSLDKLRESEESASLTDEQKQEKARKFNEDALKHAFDTKKISLQEFQDFSKEKERPAQDIVFDLYKGKWKQEDPSLTDKQMEDRFNEYFQLEADDDNWLRKERSGELNRIAKAYLDSKYEKVLNAESDFTNHLDKEKSVRDYTAKVEKVFSATLPKQLDFELEIPKPDGSKEKKTYEFKFSEDSIADVKKSFQSENSFHSSSNMSEEALTGAATMVLMQKEIKKMVATIANAHASEAILANKQGRSGIPDRQQGGTSTGSTSNTASSGPAAEMMANRKK